MALPLSHGFVLPDKEFATWLEIVKPYMQVFERVAVIRSPAGNDLNRFRIITAVQAPNEWYNDDAMAHIRRAYPMVVRIDVIQAQTPAELSSILQQRINNNDRFGEKQNVPQHIFDRFILEWPSSVRPSRIVRPFSSSSDKDIDTHEGIDITTYEGATITAGAGGTISKIVTGNDGLNYGAYIQIMTVLEGQTYTTTYGGLKNISVQINQNIIAGDEIAEAAGKTIKIVVQNPGNGMSGFQLPNIVNPTGMIYWQGIRVRPSVGILRVRSLPSTHGDVITTVTSSNLLETDETHGRTLAKLGVQDKWLKVSIAGIQDAYCAAWYLEGYGIDDPAEAIPGVNIPGMNLDIDHHLGVPDATQLKNLGWVRLLFNVSLNPNYPQGDPRRYGNTDVEFAYNRYRPIIEKYAKSGIKVILIFTHQTFGEGQGHLGFNWDSMDSGKWRELTTVFAKIARQIAIKFAGTGWVYAYQIWNEQDTAPKDARASVPMPSVDYGHLLSETIKSIRSVDGNVSIITGGHISGTSLGATYARETLAAMPSNIRPDGIAFHPYGLGPAGNRFSIFGTLGEAIRQFGRVLPGTPLWITEWGVLDRQGDDSLIGSVSEYATGCLNIIRHEFPGQIAASIWYAWADGMDNGYGMVNSSNQPKQPLYNIYLQE
jgi:hypothetical protein